MQKTYSIVASLLVLSLLSGCIVSIESDENSRGAYWDESDVGTFKRGETTSDWVLRTIGEPSRRVETEQDTEIWQFVSSDTKETTVGIIFLLHYDKERENTRQLNVEIKDDVVIDFWTREY